jgi:WD40 repeat protein
MSWEIEKWVDIRVDAGMALDISDTILTIAGAQGKIRLFEPSTFKHIVTLPRPAALVISTPDTTAAGTTPPAPLPPPSSVAPSVAGKPGVDLNTYPHVMATKISSDNKRLLTVYADRSIVIWDIYRASASNVPKILRAFQHHDSPIWDIQLVPTLPQSITRGISGGDDGNTPRYVYIPLQRRRHTLCYCRRFNCIIVCCLLQIDNRLPDGTFMSCGDDNSIRFWNVPPLLSSLPSDMDVPRRKSSNTWSEEQIHCLSFGRPIPPQPVPIKTLDLPASPKASLENKHSEPLSPRSDATTSVRIRCMQYISRKATRDRDLLISGDRQGVLRYKSPSSIPLIVMLTVMSL